MKNQHGFLGIPYRFDSWEHWRVKDIWAYSLENPSSLGVAKGSDDTVLLTFVVSVEIVLCKCEQLY